MRAPSVHFGIELFVSQQDCPDDKTRLAICQLCAKACSIMRRVELWVGSSMRWPSSRGMYQLTRLSTPQHAIGIVTSCALGLAQSMHGASCPSAASQTVHVITAVRKHVTSATVEGNGSLSSANKTVHATGDCKFDTCARAKASEHDALSF